MRRVSLYIKKGRERERKKPERTKAICIKIAPKKRITMRWINVFPF